MYCHNVYDYYVAAPDQRYWPLTAEEAERTFDIICSAHVVRDSARRYSTQAIHIASRRPSEERRYAERSLAPSSSLWFVEASSTSDIELYGKHAPGSWIDVFGHRGSSSGAGLPVLNESASQARDLLPVF